MDDKSAAQFVSLSVMVKALIHTHPDHDKLRDCIQEIMKEGFNNATYEFQDLIDKSVLNWMNGLRKRVKKDGK
jgi:hypothetical protein